MQKAEQEVRQQLVLHDTSLNSRRLKESIHKVNFRGIVDGSFNQKLQDLHS